MAKQPKDAVLIQEVFEIRYRRGYRYLDRCGDLMIVLEELLSQETGALWMTEESKPSGARMKCPDFEAILSFDTESMTLHFDMNAQSVQFDQVCILAAEVIFAKLMIDEPYRYGHRMGFMIPTDSVEEADKLSIQVAPGRNWPMPPPEHFAASSAEFGIRYESESRRGYRVTSKAVLRRAIIGDVDERILRPPHLLAKGQREALVAQQRRLAERARDPEVGLKIDIDYYALTLEDDENIRRFLADSREQIISLKNAVASWRNPQ